MITFLDEKGAGEKTSQLAGGSQVKGIHHSAGWIGYSERNGVGCGVKFYSILDRHGEVSARTCVHRYFLNLEE